MSYTEPECWRSPIAEACSIQADLLHAATRGKRIPRTVFFAIQAAEEKLRDAACVLESLGAHEPVATPSAPASLQARPERSGGKP